VSLKREGTACSFGHTVNWRRASVSRRRDRGKHAALEDIERI